jgi:hypothetical protein
MLAVQGTYNLRPAGGQPWLYRSAAIDGLNADDILALRGAGIGRVIDLRDRCELSADASGLPTSHIPIYDLPEGPPQAGTLASVYELMLFQRGTMLASAVGAIARLETPVLVHCTAGKDRTGLVVALALLAAGISEADVIADYAASGAEVAVRRRDLVSAALDSLGLGGQERVDALELHLDSPAGAMAGAIVEVRRRFGSVSEYLLRHGVSGADLNRLRVKAARASA